MRILQVVHGFPPAASAGTEVYVRNLVHALAQDPSDSVHVLTREADPRRPELAIRSWSMGRVHVVAVNNTFQSCATFEDSYANAALEQIASNLLDEWRPDVVHIQHLTCLSTGIPRQARKRGIPIAMTINDYWLICHRGQLVDLNGRRCAGPFDGGCARCIEPAALANQTVVRAGRAIRRLPVSVAGAALHRAVRFVGLMAPSHSTRAASLARLRHMQDAVRDVDLFLVPSRTSFALMREFGIPRERLVCCEQGVPLAEKQSRRGGSTPLRLGFAGGLQPTKGLHVLLDAVEMLPSGSVTLDVFGSAAPYHGDDEYMSHVRARLGHAAIARIGPAPHDRMASRLADLDVLVVPSVWLENAPFIIREAFACGVPVIASDLGGMAEMVQHERNGLLFAAGDPAALASQIHRLIDDGHLLDVLRSGIVAPMSIDADAAQLRQIYFTLAPSARAHESSTRSSRAVRVGSIAAIVLNYRTPEQTAIAVRSLQASRTPPDDLEVIDNGSKDGSLEHLRRALQGVAITALPHNIGFPAGCNAGIRAALERGAEYVLLVNSDVVLHPDAIDRLTAVMMRDPRIGIAGPVLLSREEPDRIASAGIAFSSRTGRMRHRGAGSRLATLEPGSHYAMDAISGCVMLIRREVLQRVGLLEESYFFSFEDIEFCLRARAAGYGAACVQDAIAYHEGGRTIGRRSTRRVYFATRNHLRLAAQSGHPSGRAVRTAAVLGLNAAYVLLSPEAPLFGGATALMRGAWHHFSGRYGAD